MEDVGANTMERKRGEIARELLDTERTYIANLSVLVQVRHLGSIFGRFFDPWSASLLPLMRFAGTAAVPVSAERAGYSTRGKLGAHVRQHRAAMEHRIRAAVGARGTHAAVVASAATWRHIPQPGKCSHNPSYGYVRCLRSCFTVFLDIGAVVGSLR